VSPRGFSLVELLVVIAIIMVLAAILFPIFTRAKDSGYRTVAMTQAKQLGAAALLYVDSSDNKMLPSTNYGAPETAPERLWTTVLEPQIKSKQIFIAAGSNGQFPGTWKVRGWGTVGYNSSTALDQTQGCSDDDQVDKCLAFRSVVDASKLEKTTTVALFAVTPGGEVADKYLGYEFSPYNGEPYPESPQLGPPLVSDSDLVKTLAHDLPAELIKPVYARYLSDGRDNGTTPVIFADGHAKDYSANQISEPKTGIVWRLR
jgi:prepilin-type N-terminal cleavage/methylation domain-containing protein